MGLAILLLHEPVPKFKLGLGASFDRLRTNGVLPFVVSLSNHETLFCSIFGIASYILSKNIASATK
jgi:hypothetical protein